MMAKAAGILLVLIVVGVAVTHGHRSGPTCPSGSMPAHVSTGTGTNPNTHPTGARR